MRIVGSFFLFLLIKDINATDNVECKVEINDDPFDSGFEKIRTKTVYCNFDDSIAITKPTTLSNLFNENVTKLFMGHNKNIEYLPENTSVIFPNLYSIEAFDCSVKSLNELNFKGLHKMIQVDLNKNQIETIDEHSLDDMVQLTSLNLEDNKLTNLPPNVFEKLLQLNFLHLNKNLIQELNASIFKNNKNLALLHLNDNELQTLPSGIFDGLSKVRQLWLNGNKIEDLPPQIFDELNSLIDLDLSRNKISTINANWLSKLNTLDEVSFSRNPLNFIDLNIFENNAELTLFYFNGVTTKDIRHIERVDQMPKISGIGFHDTCINDQFYKGNLDRLKRLVKKNCMVETID
ncbi:Chondroadherin [Pseudolycoriella hygida]|nr:Chondroadherin [Pseudolycoriella hygida]